MILLVLLLSSQLKLTGQSVEIAAIDEPLNQVLLVMARDYGIQLSFDDQLLSSYTISLHEVFDNPEEAIAFLIKDYPLDYKQIGDVFTLFSTQAVEPVTNHRISGRIIDALVQGRIDQIFCPGLTFIFKIKWQAEQR